jgi:hypothetical protein
VEVTDPGGYWDIEFLRPIIAESVQVHAGCAVREKYMRKFGFIYGRSGRKAVNCAKIA